ncbi:unnamed protein product [Thlaspi arvense]|uniref:Uncharacterized protein n=1 Tax=Thlaspi arvense TaxID=13288 RepID=A0AAU9RB31_THLAR|nr:unnamed protein product [Thlaspi arvense]
MQDIFVAMDKSSPSEAKPVERQTENTTPPTSPNNDETQNTTPSSPLMATPLSYVLPLGSHSPTAAPPLMVSPFQSITPFDESDKGSFDAADAGPSTGLVKRGRGRPKGSKNSKVSTKKPKVYDPNSRVVTSCPNFDSELTDAERESGNREIADSVLMRFDAVRRRLCQLECVKGVLTTAITNCRNLGVRTNTKRRVGPVPGVQVGDIFYFWGEMCLVGLHKQMIAGIDYLSVKDGATEGPLATSVVTSGHYNDETEDLQTLVYTGHGGTDKNGEAVDQKLERGNLALEASKKKGNEVRVIRGEEDPNDKKKKIYIYDGLYLVSDLWKEKAKSGFEEYKFKLVRKPDQPSGYETWKVAEKWRKSGSNDTRKGFVHHDISYGTETSPVPVVNEIDESDKKMPEDFQYSNTLTTSSYMALDLSHIPIGCSDCQGRSCSSQGPKCLCVQRNGGESPYHNRILVCRKPMIYECGDSCPCPADCKNRVSQSGLKIRVEVFKTEKCGWGLRTCEPIRAGTFICEFAGTVKLKHEVEEDDEYVFDSSREYILRFKWNYEPELVGEDCWEPVPEVFKFPSQILISAKKHGNVSRFMNHSCSPNVMCQPIEYEQNRKPRVHIGFFAVKHIPPLTELRYDYGRSYCIGEDGTQFKDDKICLCGSVNCLGFFG